MTNLTLVVLKIWVSTNLIPGWSGPPDVLIITNKDGMLEIGGSSYAINVIRPPKTIVVTNYAIELMTLTQGEK